jgi:hypothetical protein
LEEKPFRAFRGPVGRACQEEDLGNSGVGQRGRNEGQHFRLGRKDRTAQPRGRAVEDRETLSYLDAASGGGTEEAGLGATGRLREGDARIREGPNEGLSGQPAHQEKAEMENMVIHLKC